VYPRYVDPARVALARDLDAYEGVKGVLVDAVVTVAHDGAVDISWDNEDQRVGRLPECPLDGRGVEQAEGDIQRLAETPVGVVADVSCVGDDAYPQLPLQLTGVREAGVVVGQETAEGGDGAVQQERLGSLIYRADECQEAVAAVNVTVAMTLVDSRRVQRRVKSLVGLVPEFGFKSK
jgi:hypothetical protein